MEGDQQEKAPDRMIDLGVVACGRWAEGAQM
jgi:hypothetical protein